MLTLICSCSDNSMNSQSMKMGLDTLDISTFNIKSQDSENLELFFCTDNKQIKILDFPTENDCILIVQFLDKKITFVASNETSSQKSSYKLDNSTINLSTRIHASNTVYKSRKGLTVPLIGHPLKYSAEQNYKKDEWAIIAKYN